MAIEPRWSDVIVCPSPKANHRHPQYYRITTWPCPFAVVVSRSNQYRVHYVRTSANSAASNISSDASAEIALIMLIKLVCLLIGPVKVPILVCPARLPRYRFIGARRVKSSVILARVGRCNRLSLTGYAYRTARASFPSRSFRGNFRPAVV